MSIVAGSYERFMWGYDVEPTTQTLTPKFSYPAHLSPIKSVSISGPVAASTGTDDTVKLYNLETSTELGSILLHSTSATCLSFYFPSVFPNSLVAGSNDGAVHIFDINPFVKLTSVKVHKKPINDVNVHPSGRLALTVARDGCLGMVNLVRGKRSCCNRLEKEADVVRFFGDNGGKFFLCCGESVSVHQSEDAKLCGEFTAAKRILCAAPSENGLIFTGGEDRGVTAWDSASGKVVYSIEDAHKTRVKGIVILSRDGDSGNVENPFLVASASSDGVIRVWDVRATSKGKSVPLSEADTKSRLTCLAGSSIKSLKQLQTKNDAPENNTEEQEDS